MGVVVAFESGDGRDAGLDALISLVASDMERVNEAILARAQSNVELIPELTAHLVNSGGKRLRPMLTIASAQLGGYRGEAPRRRRGKRGASWTSRSPGMRKR